MKMKDQPLHERPRERLMKSGADSLSSAELIAILLRTGLQGTNVVEVAKEMLNKYRTLHALAQTSKEELQKIKGIGPDKAATLVAAFTLAKRMAGELHGESPLLDTPEAVANFLRE